MDYHAYIWCSLKTGTQNDMMKHNYNGNLTESKENQLEFSLPYGADWAFED